MGPEPKVYYDDDDVGYEDRAAIGYNISTTAELLVVATS